MSDNSVNYDNVKRIVCFGDSNTWGYNPENGTRYPSKIRWTGVLQQMLGSEYLVIEEGQNGRTIANSDMAEWGTKAGIDYVIPMLESHMPLDMLIIMLGSNDMKAKFHYPAPDIAGYLQNMLVKVKGHLDYHLGCPNTKILIVSPPQIGEDIASSQFAPFVDVNNVIEVSKELPKWYELVAEQFGCEFLDATSLVSGGKADSLHLSAESHKILAEAICEAVKKSLN